jgi:ankyrin repeat protein
MKAAKKSTDVDISEVLRLIIAGDVQALQGVFYRQPDLVHAKEETNFNTCLHVASSRGLMPVVHMLVAKKVNVNAQDMYGNTALHYACDKGRKNIIEFLLQSGSNPNLSDHR